MSQLIPTCTNPSYFMTVPATTDISPLSLHDALPICRVTFATGIAAIEAARDIQRQLVERAAMVWETDASLVSYGGGGVHGPDRKSTRLNSSHLVISYAVFCLKKKKNNEKNRSHSDNL